MMKRNLIYIMSAVALLLGSNLPTINVRAQDSGVGYITLVPIGAATTTSI